MNGSMPFELSPLQTDRQTEKEWKNDGNCQLSNNRHYYYLLLFESIHYKKMGVLFSSFLIMNDVTVCESRTNLINAIVKNCRQNSTQSNN